MKAWYILYFLMIFISPSSFGQDEKAEKKEEKAENDKVEFSAIKDVLKNDRLDTVIEKRAKEKKLKASKQKAVAHNSYNIPGEDIFWSFFSELWLVQNATVLKWNFEKPDYGLSEYFKEFLEKQGVYELKYKILVVNSPDITHYSLPSNQNEMIYLIGLPFIKAMDLSRLEISLILFEDYLRQQNEFFKQYATVKGLSKFLGSNFKGKKFNKKIIESINMRYDEMIFDRGFSFQQQYKVTTSMSNILKSDVKIWNSYYRLIMKKKELVKNDIRFKKYLKIYPSPELQLGWLNPVKKKIL